MTRRVPPLNWVKVFEAAARQESFVSAAEQLSLTPGAISRSVKELETFLGVELFIRHPRGIQLTEKGKSFAAAVSGPLEQIAVACERVRGRSGSTSLKVSVMPALGERWLVPRLGKFGRLHPQISVAVEANARVVDLVKSDYALALRYGDGNFPGLTAHELFDDEIFPVVSPDLLESAPLERPEDLFKIPALQDSFWEADWRLWFNAAGIEIPDDWPRTSFSLYSMAIDAAKAGHGVVMGHWPLIQAELDSGRLVAPFSLRVSTPKRYYIVTPNNRADSEAATRFIEWLLSETE